MTRYVAFNPASSENSEFVEGNTLGEVLRLLGERDYINATTEEEARQSLRRDGNGSWVIESIEIYELRVHPRLREEMRSWRVEA